MFTRGMSRKHSSKICRFIVKNFKSIGDPGVDLELKPLTLLFGPQGAGKSNILEAFWRIAKLFHSAKSAALTFSYLKDIEPKYGDEKSIFHKEDPSKLLTIGIFVPIENHKIGGWIIGYRHERGENKLLAFQRATLNEEVVLEIKEILNDSEHIRVISAPENLRQEPVHILYPLEQVTPEVFQLEPMYPNQTLSKELEERSKLAQRIASTVIQTLTGDYTVKVALLTALRGIVTEKVSADQTVELKGEVYPLDPDGKNLIHYLSFMYAATRYRHYLEFIGRWAKELGLTDLTAGFWGRNTLSAEFRDKDLNVPLKLAYASHGAKQALCVIAQLFSPTQDIILIEEPEISLHPESVAKLPLMFLDAIKLGKQIIATTHSTILPLALSRMVRKAKEEGLCEDPNELIAVYEIQKTENGTQAMRLELNEKGYIRDYIPSFYTIERELLNEWWESLPEETAETEET